MSPAALKASCNLKHAAGRAFERYGVSLTPGDLVHVGKGIRTGRGQAIPLRPDLKHPGRLYYLVFVKGVWLPVVFDCRTQSVVTVLPETVRAEYAHLIPEPVRKPAPAPPGPAAPDEPPAGPAPAPTEPAASAAAEIGVEEAAAQLMAIPDVPDPDLSYDYFGFGEASRRLSARVLSISQVARKKGVTAEAYELLVRALRDAARRRDEASLAAEYAFGVPAL